MQFFSSSGRIDTAAWMLNKRREKKLDGNYKRMLRAILNKSWRQHLTKQPVYGHLPPITKTIQVWWTRHAGHCWKSRDELIWTSKSRTTNSNLHTTAVPIQDIALKTCRKQRTIEKGGGKGSGIFVLMVQDDDDDDDMKLIMFGKN